MLVIYGCYWQTSPTMSTPDLKRIIRTAGDTYINVGERGLDVTFCRVTFCTRQIHMYKMLPNRTFTRGHDRHRAIKKGEKISRLYRFISR